MMTHVINPWPTGNKSEDTATGTYVNPLKYSGVKWLLLKLFSAIQV